jgi:adenylate cyclase
VTDQGKAVFLSYASQDAQSAQRICEALRAAGIDVFLDQSELRGGDAWDQKIRHEIHDCALFIPMVSQHTQERLEGYFRREWKLAIDRTHDMAEQKPFLVPVVIDGTSDKEAFVPDAFKTVQWTRLPGGETTPAFVQRVKRLLSPELSPLSAVSGAGPAIREPMRTRRRSKPVLLAAVALVVLAALAYFLANNFWIPQHATPETAARAVAPATDFNPSPHSIAVLPFADMSEKQDQGYFADGMAEEIIDLLTKIPQLTVISRTSSFQFKGREVDVKAIGSTLGSRYLVEGSVRNLGDRFRIAAQLIDTRDGANRWSETYDRRIDDAFKVQEEIAASLVRALEIAVGTGGLPARQIPKNATAYNLYLRGLQAFDHFNRDGFEQAADLFQQSLDLEPQFGAAASGLANVELFVAQWGYVPPRIGYERARQSAKLAIKLDPLLASPHVILSAVATQYDWDWAGAAHELDAAEALNARDPMVHAFRGILAISTGRYAEATSQLNAALRLEPLTPNVLFNLGWAHYWSGQMPEAEASLRRALQISPTYESAHYYLGHVLLSRGDLANALSEMQHELDEESRIAGIASVQFTMGHRAESDAALAHLTTLAADDWASGIASVHALRNEADATFQWLDRAYAQKDEDLYLIKGNPLFRNVAHDPRYKAFLRKMNLPD